MPSLLEFLGYMFCDGAVLVGPVYEIKEYFDFIEGRGIHSKEPKVSYKYFLKCIIGYVLHVLRMLRINSIELLLFCTHMYAYKDTPRPHGLLQSATYFTMDIFE